MNEVRTSRFRFTLADVLIWTTYFAAMLAIGVYFPLAAIVGGCWGFTSIFRYRAMRNREQVDGGVFKNGSLYLICVLIEGSICYVTGIIAIFFVALAAAFIYSFAVPVLSFAGLAINPGILTGLATMIFCLTLYLIFARATWPDKMPW